MTDNVAATKTDAWLISASRDDPDAFRYLYDRYATRLHSFFMRRTGSADAALDLTAETFAQAWVSRIRFRDRAGGSAAPWLFTIAKRVLTRSVSRRRIEGVMLERLQVDHSTSAHADATPNDWWLEGLDADIDEALRRLPTDQRRALELRVFADWPYAKVARELACTSTAARIRVSRGLATLRARLEGEGR